MMENLFLDADEADAIVELFNIGMGPPAASLSEMVGEEVTLSTPALRIARRSAVAGDLGRPAGERVCAVHETFEGPFSGDALLLFPDKGGLELVRRLLPDAEEGDADERDALTEIGNVIINGGLASFANLVDGEVAGSVPNYRDGPADAVVGVGDDPVLFMRIDIALASGDARGHVLFLLDIASMDAFREAVRRTLENMGI